MNTHNVDVHALPPARDVVDAGVVAEHLHGWPEVLLRPLVQRHQLIPLSDVTPAVKGILHPVLRIRSRIRIFLGLLDPSDPLVWGTENGSGSLRIF